MSEHYPGPEQEPREPVRPTGLTEAGGKTLMSDIMLTSVADQVEIPSDASSDEFERRVQSAAAEQIADLQTPAVRERWAPVVVDLERRRLAYRWKSQALILKQHGK